MSGQLDWSLAISLDRASSEPLSGQLAAALQSRIESGILATGTRLPTTRELALALGVNRGTVQAAYRILQQAGLARGRVGSGTEVRAASGTPPPFDPAELLSERVAGLSPEDSPAAGAELVADFARLTP